MQPLFRLLAPAIGVSLLTLSGCHSYAPYGSYGSYPGAYGVPPQGSYPPPGTIYQPGVQQPPMMFQGDPGYGGAAPTQLGPESSFPDSTTGTFQPNGSLSSNPGATPYEPDRGYRDGLVPEYPPDNGPAALNGLETRGEVSEPGNLDFNDTPKPFPADRPLEASSSPRPFDNGATPRSNDRRSFDSEDEPFEPDQPGEETKPAETEFDPFGSSERGGNIQLEPIEELDDNAFEPPFRQASQTSESGLPTRRPNPYAYDQNGYTWLRGVVDFDEQTGTWNLIYDLQPDRTDRYGGSVTLTGGQRLAILKPNDVVLIEGRFHGSERDQFGKPKYLVEHLARLVPRQNP